MKKQDLASKFNAPLADAIAEGFYPCLTELCGSYSGVLGSQIVLAKGRERIVMWMEERHDWTDNTVPDSVEFYVARFEKAKGESTEFHYMWPSDWKKHLVSKTTLYEVGEGRNVWYVETREEAIRAKELRWNRYDNRPHRGYFREVEVDDRLLRIARRLKGFKTIKPENLRVIHKTGNIWIFQNKTSRREAFVG